MTPRRFENRADWVSVVVETATDELTKDPNSNLYRAVTCNISGGHDYWGETANELYRRPLTLEEGLLALEMKGVVEKAALNQFRALEGLASVGDVDMDFFGFPMDFSVFMSTLEKLAVRSPLQAVQYKVLANKLTEKASDQPLTTFMTYHCLSFGETGEHWCENI